jgi:hypothetical protein
MFVQTSLSPFEISTANAMLEANFLKDMDLPTQPELGTVLRS